ncbi:MAG: hypothetical protein K2L80_02635 [Muribaculaceae bacterium]|nr:hypothetical protein [Muribaculaceae bacterium]
MKKFALFCGIALSLGFVACDDELPNPPVQEYPQPEIFDAAGLTLSQGDYGVTNPINLNEYAEKGELAPVMNITELTGFPDTYTLVLPMEVGSDADFTKTVTVETVIADNVVSVAPASFTDAVRELVSKSPAEQTVHCRFPAYAVNGNATMRLGGLDKYYATVEYKVLPYQTYTVEDEYFLVGSFCNWDINKGMKFSRLNPNGSVYDTPEFTVKFDVTAQQAAEGFQYKVVPASTVAAGDWNGSLGLVPVISTNEEGVEVTEMYGSLVSTTEAQSEAGVISQEGPYLLTVNIESMTYTLAFAIENLWVPGIGTSTSDFSKVPRLFTNDYVTYMGAAHLNKQWWLTGQASTTGLNYRTAEGTEQTVEGFVTSGEIQSYSGTDGKRMPIGTNGLYWLNVNLVTMKYTATHLSRVSLVGAFNGWDAAKAFDLTPDSKFTVWTGTVDLDGEFKINTNGEWNVDFGSNTSAIGTSNALDYKGANMSVAAGKYDVKVDFTTLPYTITLNAK